MSITFEAKIPAPAERLVKSSGLSSMSSSFHARKVIITPPPITIASTVFANCSGFVEELRAPNFLLLITLYLTCNSVDNPLPQHLLEAVQKTLSFLSFTALQNHRHANSGLSACASVTLGW